MAADCAQLVDDFEGVADLQRTHGNPNLGQTVILDLEDLMFEGEQAGLDEGLLSFCYPHSRLCIENPYKRNT